MGNLLPAHRQPRSNPFFDQDPINQLQEDIDHLLSRYSLDWDEEWTMRPVAPACDRTESDKNDPPENQREKPCPCIASSKPKTA